MVTAGALAVVGLAIDVTSIVYNSRQIHVHRKNQSNDSNNLRTPHNTEDCPLSGTRFYYSSSTEEMSYAKYVQISHFCLILSTKASFSQKTRPFSCKNEDWFNR